MAKNKNIPAQNQHAARQNHSVLATKVSTTTFSGPLPHPQHLAEYEAITPGFADRIIKMAEDESEHRRSQEQKELNADIHFNNKDFAERRIGQLSAVFIVLIMAAIGAYLALDGKEITGSVFGGPAIVSIVWAFLNKKK
jgi:uncharacterized membrane protein